MLTGAELGAAIESARKLKGVTKRAMAEHFGVTPPSVQDWVKRGTIDKAKLVAMWAYFADVAGPGHWGLPKFLALDELIDDAKQCATLSTTRANATDIEIPHWDTGGAMGRGVALKDQPGVIQSWRVSQEWLHKNVRAFSAAHNLVIVTGFGNSMKPIFNPGDPLLVDIGVRSVDADAVYFFRVGDEGFIKTLQRIPGEGIRVISANRENFDTWTITKGMDFEVFGRVLKVWCSEDF